MKISYKNRFKFTLIELITAATLTLILFMIIGFVFGSVSDCSSKLTDKISEGLKANKFFNDVANDLSAAYPVFHLGTGSSGQVICVSQPGTTDPTSNLPSPSFLPVTLGGVNIQSGAKHQELFRCVTTNHQNGGLLFFNGSEIVSNSNIDQNDKPVRYVTYNFTGTGSNTGARHERTIYRRDFPLRPDRRKGDDLRAGYSAGPFVDVGAYGDGSTVASRGADADVYESEYMDGIWEVRVEFREALCTMDITGFGRKVIAKITIEFANIDYSKPFGDPSRYTRYSFGDTDKNGLSDVAEHTYTTVVVIQRNNQEE